MKDLSLTWGKAPRAGVIDLWNSSLCEGATWSPSDCPVVRSTAIEPPGAVIAWNDAKRLHKQMVSAGNKCYHVSAFIHCYIDDQKFDGEREGIWRRWKFFYEVASHFDGILGVDFSPYVDFPEPVKRMQIYKMRAIEHGAIRRNIPVFANARWGTSETWDYCFDSLLEGNVYSIGVVGSGLENIENRPLFDAGLRKLVELKHPPALIVVGSTNYAIFEEIRKSGVDVVQLDGETCAYFKTKAVRHV